MFRSLWLRGLSRVLFAPSSSARKRHRATRRLSLQLETLEDRITPSTVINVTDAGGGMDQAANVTLSTINTANKITLRDAINLADNTGGSGSYIINLPAGNTIDFTSPVNNTTITSHNTVQNQNWYGPNALPAISSNITIEGNGDTLQVASGVNMRFFYVSGGPTLTGGALTLGTLELDNLTLEGGVAQGGNGGGGGLGAGGAIFDQGNLTLNSDTLTNNKAIGGNGGVGGGGGGGMGSNAAAGDGGGFGGNFSITGGPTGGIGTSGGGGGAGFQTTDNGAGGAGGGRGGFGGSGGGFGGSAGDGGGGGGGPFPGGSGGGFGDGGNVSLSGSGGGGGVGGGGGGGGLGGGGGFGGGGGGGGVGGLGGGVGGLGGGGGGGGVGGGGGFGGGNGGILHTAHGSAVEGGGGGGLGGGIFSMSGSLTVINSTLSGNTAQGGNGGGGSATGGSGFGGAIFNLDSNATLTYVTVANNNAINGTSGTTTAGNANGGGVYNLAFGNTITAGAANTATLTINNSAIGQNNGGNNLVNDSENGKNTNTAQINGSSSVVQGGAIQTGNGTNSVATGAITVTSVPSLATTLANNGGLTQTLAPLSGSSVVGAGNPSLAGLPTVDQRGLPRPSSTSSIKPDDGAFQTHIITTTTVTNATTTYNSAGQTIALRANVVDAFGQPVTEGQVQFIVAGISPVTATINSSNPGVASAAFTLPSTLNAGSYTIDASYTDPSNPALFNSSSGTGTLTLSPVASTLTVTDTNIPLIYNSGSETLNLTANVGSNNGGTVSEGDVVFTVNGVSSGPIAVSDGTASEKLTLTGTSLLLAGIYPSGVSASYTDAATNNYNSATATGVVALSAAATTTTLASTTVSSTFNSATAQTVSLSASVAGSDGGTVNEGNITFTATSATGVQLTAVGAVGDGNATATLTIPAGFAIGSYTITAAYADTTNSNGVSDYSDSTAANFGTLTVAGAATTTTLTTPPVSVTYNNTAPQMVTLSATVASAAGGMVNEGVVTFTVGTNLPVTANVSGGKATTMLALPAGFAAGSYTITANYADGNANDGPSTATGGALTVGAASTQTSLLSSTSSSINFNSTSPQTLTLSAAVASLNGGTVNEGSVLFTIGTVTTTANVRSGSASTTLTLPAGFAAGSYTITASYADANNANGVQNFSTSRGTSTLTIVPPPPVRVPPAVPTAPVGGLSMFALGLGPTGIDLFEVDSQGDVFAQGLFGGGLVLVNTSLDLPLAVLSNGALLALLTGDSGQNYIVDIFDPFLPLVEPVVLAALHL